MLLIFKTKLFKSNTCYSEFHATVALFRLLVAMLVCMHNCLAV